MPFSLFEADVQAVLDGARRAGGFPSPADWRDLPMYFLMLDRFNNDSARPRHKPFDDAGFADFQGGKFSGVQSKLSYIRELGSRAIWLSPPLENLPFARTYHGYGIHHFLRAEPRFADDRAQADDELRRLVDAAHKQGLHVIFDIVLNHVGDVFAYECGAGDDQCQKSGGAEAAFHEDRQNVRWRDPSGSPRADSQAIENIPNPSANALVWPKELQRNDYFRRQGSTRGDDVIGDFQSLKQFRTDNEDVQRFLIRAYQYVIARYDVDGFRIDTLRYLQGDLARIFGNAIREFALEMGKKNFFTFGEVLDSRAEEDIARFIGRNTSDQSDLVGVDAALDYPLFGELKPLSRGEEPPQGLVDMYGKRKRIEEDILSSHGDATRFFVTFLDNHDMKERIRKQDQADPHARDRQVTLGIACLYSLQGIPCLYYGTEQGLHGAGNDEAVREALWGGPGFDPKNPFYREIAKIAAARDALPALRYGRQYFRPISGNGGEFGISSFKTGVLAFSRILNDEEVVVVANTDTTQVQKVDVIVDGLLNQPGASRRIAYSNVPSPVAPDAMRRTGTVVVHETDGTTGAGPLTVVHVTLQPMEVQILAV